MSVEIRDLSASFGGVQALTGLSVALGPGITGVIGPNGAGKTTLLNVLSGFVAARQGRVTAFGTDLLALPPHRRARWGLRRSFQTEQVVDDLSVADNVRAVLDPLGLSRADKAAEIAAALAHAGLGARAAAMGAELDGFERRMVEIAKAVAGRPKLILLDEPGAGLAPAEAARLRAVVGAIPARFGAMVLLIDHDVELIAALCPTTLVLDFGRRIAFGPTAQVLRDPAVRAAYLGLETPA
jgi:branched-chain amino acid transport system ATP-binding protein